MPRVAVLKSCFDAIHSATAVRLDDLFDEPTRHYHVPDRPYNRDTPARMCTVWFEEIRLLGLGMDC